MIQKAIRVKGLEKQKWQKREGDRYEGTKKLFCVLSLRGHVLVLI